MKHFLTPMVALLLAGLSCVRAAVPPPEQLLPSDTLFLITLPDADKARAAWNSMPAAQFWSAPEMKAFRDKFMNKLTTDVLTPIEKELGVKFADYTALARGQVTLAVTLNGADGDAKKEPAGFLIIDTKDKAADAAKLLKDLKKRWVDAGKTLKTQTVRDAEFTTVKLDGKAIGKSLEKTFPKPPGSATPGAEGKESELCIGQSGSLLMFSDKPEVFEKVLVRLSGGTLPTLGEQANFSGVHSAHFRDAAGYVWFNAKAVINLAMRELEKSAPAQDPGSGMPPPAKILSALGLSGLQSFGMYATQQPEGLSAGMFVAVPEASRKGLFKMLAPEAKDASPPAFVPADAANFFRWRLDGQKTWAGIESLVVELFPPAQAIIGMVIENAGKDKDPNFDLRKMLIGNLGDDVLSYGKPPRSPKLEDIMAAPSLVLLGSPRAEQLVGAVRTGLGFMIPPGAEGGSKEREFLGRKIYSIPNPVPNNFGADSKPISFTASGSYVVISPDAPMMEEYLRATEAQGRPLRDLPGLNEAAQRVGGMATGMFGYENQTETMHLLYEAVRKEPEAFEKLFEGPLGMSALSSEMRRNRQDWLDFTLLPAWSMVAKYFHYTVYAGSTTADGLHLKTFSPTPPALKK